MDPPVAHAARGMASAPRAASGTPRHAVCKAWPADGKIVADCASQRTRKSEVSRAPCVSIGRCACVRRWCAFAPSLAAHLARCADPAACSVRQDMRRAAWSCSGRSAAWPCGVHGVCAATPMCCRCRARRGYAARADTDGAHSTPDMQQRQRSRTVCGSVSRCVCVCATPSFMSVRDAINTRGARATRRDAVGHHRASASRSTDSSRSGWIESVCDAWR